MRREDFKKKKEGEIVGEVEMKLFICSFLGHVESKCGETSTTVFCRQLYTIVHGLYI